MEKRYVYPAVLLGLLFSPSITTAITVNDVCTINASGEACLYDLQATADGPLQACTKAGRTGVRWRASAAEVNTTGAVNSVGTGSTTAFTGCVQRNVVSGKSYEVLVTYERPLQGSFPTSVTTQLVGPIRGIPTASVIAERPIDFVEPQTCRQIREGAVAAAAVDAEDIACSALVMCRIASAADTDAFRFIVPAQAVASINIADAGTTGGFPCWALTCSGTFITSSCGEREGGPLAAGECTIVTSWAGGSGGTYGLSLQGVSQTYSCGTSIAPGGPEKRGRIDQPGDTDAFEFNALAGQIFDIRIADLGTTGGFPCWEFFAPNGSFISQGSLILSRGFEE